MIKSEMLRCRIKQLEHQNKILKQDSYRFKNVLDALEFVTLAYEAKCRRDGYTQERIESLRPAFLRNALAGK